MGQLEDRVAVVTGGGRGIGRAIALRYTREGATVVVSSRTADDLEAVLRDIAEHGGRPGHFVVADATDRDDARRPVTEALDRFGRVDALVNNVGGVVGRSHDPYTGDDQSFEGTLVLSLTSAWWTSRAALPSMRDHGFGRIINIGSGASKGTGGSARVHHRQTRIGRLHEATRGGDRRRWHHRELPLPRLDEHVARRLRANRPSRGCVRRGCSSRAPRTRPCNDACWNPRSWPAWPCCSPATTVGASPAR